MIMIVSLIMYEIRIIFNLLVLFLLMMVGIRKV